MFSPLTMNINVVSFRIYKEVLKTINQLFNTSLVVCLLEQHEKVLILKRSDLLLDKSYHQNLTECFTLWLRSPTLTNWKKWKKIALKQKTPKHEMRTGPVRTCFKNWTRPQKLNKLLFNYFVECWHYLRHHPHVRFFS